MPRIDKIDFKKGKFKKTTVRSWDEDLLSKLLIDKDNVKDNKEAKATQSKYEQRDKQELIENETSNNENRPISKADESVISKATDVEQKNKKSLHRKQDAIFSSNKGSELELKKEYKRNNKGSGPGLGSYLQKSNVAAELEVKDAIAVKREPKGELGRGEGIHGSSYKLNDDKSGEANELSFLDEDFVINKRMRRLSGNERKVLSLIVEICIQKKGLKTGVVSSEDFDGYLGITRNSRETALKRLCGKGLLKRNPGKRGLRGVLSFSLSEKVLMLAKTLMAEGVF